MNSLTKLGTNFSAMEMVVKQGYGAEVAECVMGQQAFL